MYIYIYIYIGTDMKGVDGSDTTTDSGYPRVVYEWQRGTPLKDAVKVCPSTRRFLSFFLPLTALFFPMF
jgi:prolyl oligopeptidase PreP (S9A serine peptidase family)